MMAKFLEIKKYFKNEEEEKKFIRVKKHKIQKRKVKRKIMKNILLLALLLISIIIALLKIVKIFRPIKKIPKMRNEILGINISNISEITQILRNDSNKNIINVTNENNNYEIQKNLSKRELLENGRKFLDKCLEGILINNNAYNDKLNLDSENEILISVVIPVYNSQKTIKYSIRSVQNQNIKNIEIILVNDFSNDNTSKIIEELQNEDKRIKIINNDKNMGILYTRSVGALFSKGKYIFTLDNDDMFFDSDVLEIYKKAEKESYDIIAFSAINGDNYYSTIDNMKENGFHRKNNNLVVSQPKLSIYPISKNENAFELNDPHIWGKCIKNDLYKRAVNALGKERYSVYNCMNEDVIIIFVICTLANNYIFIKKYGIFHLVSRSSAIYNQKGFNPMINAINLIEIMLDFLPNIYKKYAAIGAIHLRRDWVFRIDDINVKQYLNSTINKILDSELIEQNYKYRLRNSYEGIFF